LAVMHAQTIVVSMRGVTDGLRGERTSPSPSIRAALLMRAIPKCGADVDDDGKTIGYQRASN
jgi:hypothetical protein